MHFAAHGHTAAEIVYLRADADKDFMGMTAFDGKKSDKSRCIYCKELFTGR